MAEYVVEFGKDGGRVEPDGRLDAPAFHRNHQAIWAVLRRFLAGKSGDVLEAGSGTGQHVVHFARNYPDITWWPSDLNEQHLKSIEAWRVHSRPAEHPRRRCGSICPIPPGPVRCRARVARTSCSRCSAPMSSTSRRGAVAEGLFAGAGRLFARRRAALSLRSVQARRQAHRAQQRGVRHQPARRAIRNGACATSRRSGRPRGERWSLAASRSPRCPPTT